MPRPRGGSDRVCPGNRRDEAPFPRPIHFLVGARKNAETGRIEALLLDGNREAAGDFFIDCTGFRRRLICGEMGAEWVSYRSTLPVTRAMPFWLDHEDGSEMSPFTLALAQEAGWMWSISTQDRIGCGYVYSDHFRTPDEAKAEIERTLGRKIEPARAPQ